MIIRSTSAGSVKAVMSNAHANADTPTTFNVAVLVVATTRRGITRVSPTSIPNTRATGYATLKDITPEAFHTTVMSPDREPRS